MPFNQLPLALLQAYQQLDGAPFSFDGFKVMTGVHHGLFPDVDRHLPPKMTRDMATDIQSFFATFANQPTEKQSDWYKASRLPGKHAWHKWINDCIDKVWKVHDLVCHALRDIDCHPLTIKKDNPEMTEWPPADHYIALAIDTIGMYLFGEDAFPKDSDRLPFRFRALAGAFGQRSWDLMRRQMARRVKTIDKSKAKAKEAFDAITETSSPTKGALTKAIRAVAKWRETVELCAIPDAGEAVRMTNVLKDVLKGLEEKVAKNKKGKKIEKGKQKETATVETVEDVIDLQLLFSDYFKSQEDADPVRIDLSLATAISNDLGMEYEVDKDPTFLASILGLPRESKLPALFNQKRHAMGLDPWTNPTLFTSPEHAPHIQDLRLHWHQLAGVCSIIRNTFHDNPKEPSTSGMLIADQVGLGKTSLCLATIAYIIQVIQLQQSNSALPPILQKLRYLNGSDTLEALPHIIIVPGTLQSQWISEIHTCFVPNSVHILVYDPSKPGFWDDDGPFHTSSHPIQNRIIITTHSAIQAEFKKVFVSPGQVANPLVMPTQRSSLEKTLFGQRFATASLDEAHEFRNNNAKHLAALGIMRRANLRLILTGTPLLTAPKDLASLARLVGVPYFLTDSALTQARRDQKAITRARKKGSSQLSRVQIQIVRRIQGEILPSILRRTTSSLTWEKKTLLDLPPMKKIVGIIEQTQREQDILLSRQESTKENANLANERGFSSSKFYLECRLGVGYAKEDPDAPNPVFESMEEWEQLKSTKMDVCAQIVRHYLECDDIPDVEFVDGKPVFPPRPPSETPPSRTRKVLIFAEFPSLTPILINVLKLYGIDPLWIHGSMSFATRDRLVDEFKRQNKCRVLIFSSVGSKGLNLSCADVVIFQDQPWSAQDEDQIEARAHRQPQKKVVRVIHLLVNNTTDILLHELATQKGDMFSAFVNRDMVKELESLIYGETIPELVDAEEAIQSQKLKAKKGKAKKVVSKQHDTSTRSSTPPSDTMAYTGDLDTSSMDIDLVPQERPQSPVSSDQWEGLFPPDSEGDVTSMSGGEGLSHGDEDADNASEGFGNQVSHHQTSSPLVYPSSDEEVEEVPIKRPRIFLSPPSKPKPVRVEKKVSAFPDVFKSRLEPEATRSQQHRDNGTQMDLRKLSKPTPLPKRNPFAKNITPNMGTTSLPKVARTRSQPVATQPARKSLSKATPSSEPQPSDDHLFVSFSKKEESSKRQKDSSRQGSRNTTQGTGSKSISHSREGGHHENVHGKRKRAMMTEQRSAEDGEVGVGVKASKRHNREDQDIRPPNREALGRF